MTYFALSYRVTTAIALEYDYDPNSGAVRQVLRDDGPDFPGIGRCLLDHAETMVLPFVRSKHIDNGAYALAGRILTATSVILNGDDPAVAVTVPCLYLPHAYPPATGEVRVHGVCFADEAAEAIDRRVRAALRAYERRDETADLHALDFLRDRRPAPDYWMNLANASRFRLDEAPDWLRRAYWKSLGYEWRPAS